MNDNLLIMIHKFYKILIKILITLLFVISISILWINKSTESRIYSDISKIPQNRVGLVPGCNKYIADGVINIYYTQRIDAAVELYNKGKINFILVSGDNAFPSYDEPREMKKSLIEMGIPKDIIYSDYAGFRTLDTIIRAQEVFVLTDLTLISQSFQNQRGVFIGNNRDMNIVAFNADYKDQKSDFKIFTREVLAKIKMLIDLYIIDKEPKFLGDEITIGEV